MTKQWKMSEYCNSKFEDDKCIGMIMRDVSGGRITMDQIDEIKASPKATQIRISGLVQETFDYFIDNYAQQFEVIYFWKCPLVHDLSKLSSLKKAKYILWFWNQRATEPWNMKNNTNLIGLCIEDFSRMHTLKDVPSAPALEEFEFGDKVWITSILESLKPLSDCQNLKYLCFSAKKIQDNDIKPIADIKKLEELIFFDKLFETEQIACITAKLPNVKSEQLAPFWTHSLIEWKTNKGIKMKDTRICGKGKPLLDSIQDKKRIDRYVKEFEQMVERYKNE